MGYNYFFEISSHLDFNAISINTFNTFWYPMIISFIFLIDTLVFALCYLFEADILHNKLRTVEQTFFGWTVTLLCYPPFNALGGNYLSWPATIFPEFYNIFLNFIIRLSILFLFFIYLWSTLSLGTKASNLTNRGIVSCGPYAVVRHPAYITKNLAWWISIIPVISPFNIMSMFCWSLIYFFRAITEERHLIRDPDYQKYCLQVKYRFIPFIW